MARIGYREHFVDYISENNNITVKGEAEKFKNLLDHE